MDLRAKGGPEITGCHDCQVPDKIARLWPEAWRAMAHRLSENKLEQLA